MGHLLALCTITSPQLTTLSLKPSSNQNWNVKRPLSPLLFDLSFIGSMGAFICYMVFMGMLQILSRMMSLVKKTWSVKRQWLIVKLCNEDIRSYTDTLTDLDTAPSMLFCSPLMLYERIAIPQTENEKQNIFLNYSPSFHPSLQPTQWWK